MFESANSSFHRKRVPSSITKDTYVYTRPYSREKSLRWVLRGRVSGECCTDRLHCSPRSTVKNMSIPASPLPLGVGREAPSWKTLSLVATNRSVSTSYGVARRRCLRGKTYVDHFVSFKWIGCFEACLLLVFCCKSEGFFLTSWLGLYNRNEMLVIIFYHYYHNDNHQNIVFF